MIQNTLSGTEDNKIVMFPTLDGRRLIYTNGDMYHLLHKNLQIFS